MQLMFPDGLLKCTRRMAAPAGAAPRAARAKAAMRIARRIAGNFSVRAGGPDGAAVSAAVNPRIA